MTTESRTSAMTSVVKLVEDYIDEALVDKKEKKEVEVKMRFLQKLKEINKLSKDMEKEMKVSLKGDVMQIRRELEAGNLKDEDIPDELRREIYEDIFPEIQISDVEEEEEETVAWMRRSFKIINESNVEKELVNCAIYFLPKIIFRLLLISSETNFKVRK